MGVSGGAITGKLKYYDDDTKSLVQEWGEGYFIAVGFDDFSTGLTYANVKVGLYPSTGSGLVTLDSDKDAVMKIDPALHQQIIAVQEDEAGHKFTQYWRLDKLTYLPKED